MADDEVKIKLVAEDKYSQSIERQIKMMEKMAKRAEEINKRTKQSSKQVEEFNKRAKEIELRVRTNKVTKEIQEIDKKYQALKKKFQGKALMIRLGIEDSIAQRMNSIKELTSKIKIGATNGTSKVFNKVKNDISALVSKSKVLRNLKVAIQDRAGPVVNKIKGKLQSLKTPYKITTYLQDRASTKLIKLEARAKWAVSKLKALKNIPAGVKDKASPVIEKIKAKTAWMKKGAKLAISAKDKVSGAIGGMKSKLGGLMSMAAKGITVAVAVVGAGALSALKDGMQLEQQTISMEHFIGVNNDGKSKSQIKGMTDDYIKYLRNNAKKTPFTTEEVMGAGSRAIGVAGGDIAKAQKMLELSEDMAALSPGKTVMDAMEALADADLGEMERLKEFGFKGSKEQFDAAGGDILKMQNDKGFGLEQLFSGGAEKLSTSGAGLWSTIMGGLGDIKTDIGTQLLDKVKPGLQSAVAWLDKNGPALTESISNVVASGLNKITKLGGKAGKAFEPLVKTAQSAFERLQPTFKSIGETAGKLFDSLVENGVPLLQGFIDFATPIFDKLWNLVLKPFIDWIISQMPVVKEAFQAVLDFLGPKLETLIELAGLLGPVFKLAWEIVKGAIQIAWAIIEPIATWMWEKLQMLIDKVKEMQDKYGPALSAIGGFFTGLWGKVKEVAGWIVEKIDWIIEKAQAAAEAVKSLFESDGPGLTSEQQIIYNSGGATSDTGGMRPLATGLREIPRDNYPALLHKGEAVIPARDNRGKRKGNVEDGRKEATSGKQIVITIPKLADQIVVRKEDDIDTITTKVAKKIVKELEEADVNTG